MIVMAGRSAGAARYLWHGHAAAIVAAPTSRSLHVFAMPKGCTAHGLREAACRRLAEAGCSAIQIMAFGGHRSLREAQKYVEAGEKTRLAPFDVFLVSPIQIPCRHHRMAGNMWMPWSLVSDHNFCDDIWAIDLMLSAARTPFNNAHHLLEGFATDHRHRGGCPHGDGAFPIVGASSLVAVHQFSWPRLAALDVLARPRVAESLPSR
jgi:hypothetical protein